MARVESELAETAAVTVQVARDQVIAAGDPETIAWALDQFREAEALLRRVTADCDGPPGEVKGAV
ncbi:hypothetical protein GGD83_004833 [Rhodoblastus sphagnicola]|nr:hypothetical protein [Rhodoblastus sphagnicola]MBB4201003.1 hypothetical protein [Rhodoblastus sphagnicola]